MMHAHQQAAFRENNLDSEEEMLVIFRLDGRFLALPLDMVEKGVRAVAVTPIAGAPDRVMGVIDVAGRIMPVFDLRRCLRLPTRDVALTDQLLLVMTRGGSAALLVDSLVAVARRGTREALTDEWVHRLGPVDQIMESPEGLVLIHDLDRLLFPPQADGVDDATGGAAER